MTQKKHLIKIVNSNDSGGVKSAELAFTKELRNKGAYVTGLIVGDGPTTNDYKNVFDDYVIVNNELPSYKGARHKRFLKMVQGEIESRKIARQTSRKLNLICSRKSVIAVSVRRPNHLILTGLLARDLNCPAIWHMPGCVNDLFGRYYYRYVLRNYNITPIGNSHYTLRTLGINKGHVVYPGFSAQRVFSKPTYDLRTSLKIPADTKIFGVVARITKDKAPDLIMEAFLKSDAFIEGAHLIIAGGPLNSSLGKTLIDMASAQGKGQIHFIGYTDDVAAVYSCIDVLINGRRSAEPFGISIVEAMAAGIPIIAYNAGGPSETIKHQETGWLVPNPTVIAYADAINEAWHTQNLWPSMKAASKIQAKKFSVDRQVDNYLKILIHLTKKTR